ncbi:MAG: DegT/DnrJ/EryC1/StrS aminotransferase family protein [Proteobacteria bacterium]|nr:DegT/DnrJ/EryC1/StrS aminotransferase family protein [Pseudomonadota bacterium]
MSTPTNIAFVDLKAQQARLKPQLDERMNRVLAHGQYIMGPEVAEFEDALAAFAEAQESVCVANGTDALHIALMAEGIGPGDAVFLPSFTFAATAEVVLLRGAEPVFCEVDGRTFNIDTDDLRAKIEAVRQEGRLRPRAIVAVDLFGLPANYEELTTICQVDDLFLLADAAQSFGASLGEDRVGTLAPVTATSFFPAKPLGCYGDGGALITDDPDRAAQFRSIRAHGKGAEKYDIARIGLNSRLDTLQAAVLLAKISIFQDELNARKQVAGMYTERLAGVVTTPLIDNASQSAWAQYAILLDDRDAVAGRLKENGIPTAIYYPKPMHLQSAYIEFGDGAGSLPASETLSKRILCLPMHPYLDEETIDSISAHIRAAVS